MRKHFTEVANPNFFDQHPQEFWYFYGQRHQLYKDTAPHSGFDQLLNLTTKLKDPTDSFVITSNVDGHFQKSGFDPEKVYEVHGTLQKVQCYDCYEVAEIGDHDFQLDHQNCRAHNIPLCGKCGMMMRPNVLLFNDYYWIGNEASAH